MALEPDFQIEYKRKPILTAHQHSQNTVIEIPLTLSQLPGARFRKFGDFDFCLNDETEAYELDRVVLVEKFKKKKDDFFGLALHEALENIVRNDIVIGIGITPENNLTHLPIRKL